MKPHFVCFLKEDQPLEIYGKTMVYNLNSHQGLKAFNHALITLERKYLGLISYAETKGDYRIQTRPLSTGFVAQHINCAKFPSICVPTSVLELVRKVSLEEIRQPNV